MKHQKLYRLVLAALCAALTFVATNIIHVPIPATDGYINLGDCVVLLGAFLLGPVYGAAAGGVGNAVAVVGDMVGEVTFCGPGAGRYPTASAVVADIIDIVQHPGREQPTGWEATGGKPECYHEFTARWYIRTKQSPEAVEAKLGPVAWLAEQEGYYGGLTAVMRRGDVSGSGLALDAAWPVYG